jgi:hypothetical protein
MQLVFDLIDAKAVLLRLLPFSTPIIWFDLIDHTAHSCNPDQFPDSRGLLVEH